MLNNLKTESKKIKTYEIVILNRWCKGFDYHSTYTRVADISLKRLAISVVLTQFPRGG